MKFSFDKADLRIDNTEMREWILTNGLGSYASSSLQMCNTRKYHGLLNINLAEPAGRFVLLSHLEEAITIGEKECYFSTKKHSDIYYPDAMDSIEKVEIEGYPSFVYAFDDFKIKREICMLTAKNAVLVKYSLETKSEQKCTLKINPLIAFRDIHKLTLENPFLDKNIKMSKNGFSTRPYPDLPSIEFLLEAKQKYNLSYLPTWVKSVHYTKEEARGFNSYEDLYSLACFNVEIKPDEPIYFAASCEELKAPLSELWQEETEMRNKKISEIDSLLDYLKFCGEIFISRSPNNLLEIIAGYPWFQAWGRDTFISLPGLCFVSGRIEDGKQILKDLMAQMKDGLFPNMLSSDGNNSYNTVDASLWFVRAIQALEQYSSEEEDFLKQSALPAIQDIIKNFSSGMHCSSYDLYIDEKGLLHAGNEHTQLTWMDALVANKPVTPRSGYAVELNALWFNALCYCKELELRFYKKSEISDEHIAKLKKSFREAFWVEAYGGYLADSFNARAMDRSIRPNQLFALALPYQLLSIEDEIKVFDTVKSSLLVPFGLRTLSPMSVQYKGKYEGSSSQRDSAYHQGTAWPWLIGAYVDALLSLKKSEAEKEAEVAFFLEKTTPLFTVHLKQAGIHGISEIFSGDEPYSPDGCPFQAWSVAGCCRALTKIKEKYPQLYMKWEQNVLEALKA